MLHLNENIIAKTEHYNLVYCWLSIKLKGKYTVRNRTGHRCNDSSCIICNKNIQRMALDSNFRRVLLENDNLKGLILSSPSEIKKLNNKISRRLIRDFGLSISDIKKDAKKLFVTGGYKNWYVNDGHNYTLATNLNRSTCTYCNRLYTNTLKSKGNNKIMVPQFDHWFTKSDYPFLALSFHNLIPSCSICNSSVKSSVTFKLSTHLHPYIDNFDGLFYFSYKKKNFIDNNVSIKNLSLLDLRIQNTLSAFKTLEIYNSHSSSELRDLLDMRYKYNNNYLDILFNKTFKGNISEPEKYKFIFGTELDEKDFHKRPFSKFKKDILQELKLIP